MYLTRIEMNGFKSFHTKKEILVKKGITGVVGPNGSGKSNIADAIRWVLGEQSAKNLRGTNMGDVIFNGTDDVPKKGYCEVELTFDNSDGRVKSDFSEVSVKRKLYRSGESEYYINGTVCRLKDVVELFRDTGIGKEGYSIIGQGKIDEILNSKPHERVSVFEEAAGVMKYRVKKEEAERNLTKTKANLLRLEDIIHELETQVEPLREQMDAAKQFFSLKEELKGLEINLYLYNCDHTRERIEKLGMQQKENAEESEENSALIERLSNEIAELRAKSEEIQKTLELNHRDIAEKSQEREKLRGEYNLILEKENNLTREKKEIEDSIRSNSEKIEEDGKALDELKNDLEALNAESDQCFENIKRLESERDASRESALSYTSSADDVKAEFNSVREQFEEAKRVCARYETRSELIRDSLEKYRRDGSELSGQHSEAKERYEASKKKLDDSEAAGERLSREANEINSLRLETRQKRDENQEELSGIRSSLAQKQSSRELLLDLKDSYEGYASGIKSLFKSENKGHFKNGLIGTVADLIKVPKKYEIALETVLGNALQDVVVRDEKSAKEAIEYLRQTKSGRVTFLPIDTIKPKYFTKEESEGFAAIKGVRGIASTLIECDDDIRPAVDFLLSRTVIIDELDSAFAFMKKTGYSVKTVTEKGDILRPGGSVTGGSTDKQSKGFLSRNRMIEELASDIEDLEKKASAASAAQDELESSLKELEEKHAASVKAIEDNAKAVSSFRAEAGSAETLLKSIEERIGENDALIAGFEKDYAECGEKYEEEKTKLGVIEDKYAEVESRLGRIETGIAEISSDTERLTESLQEASLLQKELIGRKEKLLLQMEHLNSDISTCSKENEESELRLTGIQKQLDSGIENERKDILNKLDEAHIHIKDASESVKKIYTEKERIESDISDKVRMSSEATARQNELIEQKYRIASQIDKSQLQMENMENRIWEEYSLTYANALPFRFEQFSVQSSTRRINEIRGSLGEMGPVNPNAIDDYNRVSERLEDMLVQKHDLEKASDDLISVIASLTRDMESCFNEKFTLINEKFQQVFKELFGGGKASLELVEEDGPNGRGIDIIAEPPGKKLQRLTLLSGGEKALCAIALLFAMLDINPSPICLLDEIDAPLDDNNLYRFTDYLTKLAEELQFIVITHRKPTMSVCDTLYGIAMRKKGISEILSVELS